MRSLRATDGTRAVTPIATVRATSAALAAALAACSPGSPGSAAHGIERAAVIDDASPPSTPARGKVIGGERVRRAIAWPDDAHVDLVARGKYTDEIRTTLTRSPVPVLAPAEPSDRVTAAVGEHWYALTVHGDGYLLHTRGSGQARVHPHVRTAEPTHPMRVAGGYLTRNEDIWVASWLEHGAAYSFEIECDRRVVPWCDDEAEILARVEALTYIGSKAGAR